MKWELYLSKREWLELQAAVRERATPPGEKRPRCEWCGVQHGKLRRNRRGYLVPVWLHTPHRKGAPLKSKNPDDYLALCPACHMRYDRAPDADGLVKQYREGYAVTSTGTLVEALAAIGCEVWGVVGEGWYWRIDDLSGGPEDSPARAVAMVVARLRSALVAARVLLDGTAVMP
jgi:hypothetical protein